MQKGDDGSYLDVVLAFPVWRDNYTYGVVIDVPDQNGKKHSWRWGSLPEKVKGNPLDLAKEIIRQMRNGDLYTAESLA